jgi:hypothetical protein
VDVTPLGHRTPDGRWEWNGTAWVPAAAPARRTHRARWVIGILVIIALLISGAVGLYEHQARTNWKRMAQALDTFPVPTGYRVLERKRYGSMACGYSPCEWPYALIQLQGPDTLAQQCDILTKAQRQWPGVSSLKRDPDQGIPCAWQGTVGHIRFWTQVGTTPMQVMVAPARADENCPCLWW